MSKSDPAKNAQHVAASLRAIVRDQKRRLAEFEALVENVERAPGIDVAYAMRLFEAVDNVVNLHKGSTDAMHVRDAQAKIVKAAAGEDAESAW